MINARLLLTALLLLLLVFSRTLLVYGQDRTDNLTADHMYYEKSGAILRAQTVRFRSGSINLAAAALRYDIQKEILHFAGTVKVDILKIGGRSQSVALTADKLTYYKQKQLLTAEGNVLLRFNSNELTGNFLEYNESRHTVMAPGKVRIKDDAGGIVEGENFRWDVNVDLTSIEELAYQFSVDNIVYYGSGRRMLQLPEKLVVEAGSLSTCTLKQPHYHFTSEKMEYYPNDKIILTASAYWDEQRKLYERDKLVLSLKDEITAGYSPDEGAYLKTSRRYTIGEQDYGILHRDYMTYKGFGLGFKEYYFSPENVKREYSLYGAGNGNSNTTLKGEYNLYTPDKSALLSLQYDDFRRRSDGSQLQGSLSIASNAENWQQYWQLNFNKQTTEWFGRKAWSDQTNIQLSESIRLSDHLRGAVTANAYRSRFMDSGEQHDHNYAVSLDYSDGNNFAQFYHYQSKYGLDYTPKISLNSSFNTPIQFELASARIKQNYGNLSVQQNDITASYVSQPINVLGQYFSYYLNAGLTEFSNRDSFKSVKVSPSLQTNITSDLYLGTRYNIQRQTGYNPVTAAVGQNAQTLDWDLKWRISDIHNAAVTGGYDLDSKLYTPLNLSVQGSGYPFWNWNLAASYDLNQNQVNTIGIYTVLNQQTGITGYVGVNYSPQLHMLQNLSGRLQFDINKAWDIDMQFYYDVIDKKFNATQIDIARKLHCRDIRISIQPHERQYFAYYVLKNP